MDIPIHQMAAISISDCPFPPQIINHLDCLTKLSLTHPCNQLTILCTQCWSLVQTSAKFWENISLLLHEGLYFRTRVQALLLLGSRIGSNWWNEEQAVRVRIKQYLCEELQNYCKGEMNEEKRYLSRGVNSAIVEILKYEWNAGWEDFLPGICSAIYDEPKFAHNYFELLIAIFTQVFSEQKTMTSQEIGLLRSQIIKNYPKIQRCFEKYLLEDTPPQILRNCVKALRELVDWLPSFHLYLGQIIDKLISLGEKPGCDPEVIFCVLEILVLPNSEKIDNLWTKFYQKKRRNLLLLITNKKVLINGCVIQRLLLASLQFLKQQKEDIEEYGAKVIMPDQAHKDQNVYILQNLLKILVRMEQITNIKCSSILQKQSLASLFHFIFTGQEDQFINLNKIMPQILQITPSPIDSSPQPEDKQYRKIFIQLMTSIICKKRDQYLSYMWRQLQANLQDSTFYDKILWNFYYFVHVFQGDLKMNLFHISQILLEIENKLYNLGNPKKPILDTIDAVKLGLLLIVSHQKSLNTDVFQAVFIDFVNKILKENDEQFVERALNIIKLSYSQIQEEDKSTIHKLYTKKMDKRLKRLGCDLIYVQMVSKWAALSQLNMKIGYGYVKDVIKWYQIAVKQLKSIKITSIRNSQRNLAEEKLFTETLSYLKVIQVSIPFFKEQLVFEMNEDLMTIGYLKQTIKLNDLGPDHLQFISLALQASAWSFTMLSEDKKRKNAKLIVEQSQAVRKCILKDLNKEEICLENIGSMLNYLGEYIVYIGGWFVSEDFKVEKAASVIQFILEKRYSGDVPGYCKFLFSVFKSSVLVYLPHELIEKLIIVVYQLALHGTESVIAECLLIFKLIYSESVTNLQLQKVILPYFLNSIQQNYVLVISQMGTKGHVGEYCDVLYTGLILAKNMKLPLFPNGQEAPNNIQFVTKILLETTKRFNTNYTEEFLGKILKFLEFMLNVNDKVVFGEKMKDLVIILARGY